MKNITKSIGGALLIVALFFSSNLKAQTMQDNPWRFGIGVEGGIPTGALHSLSNFELGGTARLQYDLMPKFAITLTSGYYNLFVKSSSSPTTTFGNYTYSTTPHSQGIIPVKIGVKDFIAKDIYISLETGAGFETKYDTDTKMILSPGIGYADKSIDVGVRYEYFAGQGNDYGFAALRIAYGFAL